MTNTLLPLLLPLLLACIYNIPTSTSFLLTPTTSTTFHRHSSNHHSSNHHPNLVLFGFFDKAFSNEDLGARPNAGLKNGPTINDAVTINGKPCKNAVVGQKLSIVANAARVKISYNCQKGDCGTCMVKVNGRKAKACQAIVPKGACKIETL